MSNEQTEVYAVGKSDLKWVLFQVFSNEETAKLWKDALDPETTEFGGYCGTEIGTYTVNNQTPDEAKKEIASRKAEKHMMDAWKPMIEMAHYDPSYELDYVLEFQKPSFENSEDEYLKELDDEETKKFEELWVSFDTLRNEYVTTHKK